MRLLNSRLSHKTIWWMPLRHPIINNFQSSRYLDKKHKTAIKFQKTSSLLFFKLHHHSSNCDTFYNVKSFIRFPSSYVIGFWWRLKFGVEVMFWRYVFCIMQPIRICNFTSLTDAQSLFLDMNTNFTWREYELCVNFAYFFHPFP